MLEIAQKLSVTKHIIEYIVKRLHEEERIGGKRDGY